MYNISQSFTMGNKHGLMLYNAEDIITLRDKPYFNKNTISISIVTGVEGNSFMNQISDQKITLISVYSRVTNYFGDKSGRHYKNKRFFYDGQNFYNSEGEQIDRLPKEAKMAFEEYSNK